MFGTKIIMVSSNSSAQLGKKKQEKAEASLSFCGTGCRLRYTYSFYVDQTNKIHRCSVPDCYNCLVSAMNLNKI